MFSWCSAPAGYGEVVLVGDLLADVVTAVAEFAIHDDGPATVDIGEDARGAGRGVGISQTSRVEEEEAVRRAVEGAGAREQGGDVGGGWLIQGDVEHADGELVGAVVFHARIFRTIVADEADDIGCGRVLINEDHEVARGAVGDGVKISDRAGREGDRVRIGSRDGSLRKAR